MFTPPSLYWWEMWDESFVSEIQWMSCLVVFEIMIERISSNNSGLYSYLFTRNMIYFEYQIWNIAKQQALL